MDLLSHLRAIPTVPEIAEMLLLARPETPWANEGGVRHLVRRTLYSKGN